VIKAHGGIIVAENGEKGGAVFNIRIPVRDGDSLRDRFV
jgi:K+-sensing histidine kinase KdpD